MGGNSRQSFAFPLSGMLGGVSPTVLEHYNPTRPKIISADASNTGLGAVLFQVQDDGQRRPVCYASRSLSDTEKRCAVIEKEALATTWASERFSDYVVGIPFTLETDRKPLTVLLNSSKLSKMPSILRFRLRIMRYNYQVQYVPGKNQVTADTLSRAPIGLPGLEYKLLFKDLEAFSIRTTSCLPATPNRLQQIRDAQKTDEECSLLRSYCLQGWPLTCLTSSYYAHIGKTEATSRLLMNYSSMMIVY